MSPEPAAVLRGADLLDLPVASLVGITSRRASMETDPRPGGAGENVDDAGPSVDDLVRDAYESGFAEGVGAVEQSTAAAVASALGAIEVAVGQLEAARDRWMEIGPADTIDLALKLAELIVRREVAARENPGRDAIVRCLGEISKGEGARIRLNPDDLERLGDVDDLVGGRPFELVADPSLASGDAIADLEFGSVDACLGSALERVAAELRS